MKNTKYSILGILLLTGLIINSCEVLEPENENVYDLDDIKSTITYAEGILLTAYRDLPASYADFTLSYGCDEAVTNDKGSGVKTAVAGGWTAYSNPFGRWNGDYGAILYLNTFLEEMTNITWYYDVNGSPDAEINESYTTRLMGEAYGLRAWYYFRLLQAHAGLGANGQMLGVPIVDHVLDPKNPDDYKIPRSSFNDLVAFILSDCDKAIERLPDRYINTGDFYHDEPMGEQYHNRFTALAARVVKVKTLLYAASPAYSDGTYTYQRAAEEAAALMDLNGGLSQFTASKHRDIEFYNSIVISRNNEHSEVFWISSQEQLNSWERNNYPPSLYGNGRTNPTQELVNAFPMADGTPADDGKINSNDPYSGRDARLDLFILYNGSDLGRAGIKIDTREGTQDAVGSSDPNTTLTGYYLKKFMNVKQVNVDPTVNSQTLHYYVYARYTDVLLMFAEAANEAVGPDGNIGGYTAREVINAIRARAKIGSTAYVDGLDQVGLRDLIRNERRIELCFEDQRFWDLRRWEMTDVMKQPVHGVQVSADGTSYSYVEVEDRNYQDYQIYGPIPYGETQKYEIVQNQGW